MLNTSSRWKLFLSAVSFNISLTLTLIHPAFQWTYWVTHRCHSCLLRAADWASSHKFHLLQIFLDYASSNCSWSAWSSLVPAETSQYNACCGGRWWSIRSTCPSQQSLRSVRMLSMVNSMYPNLVNYSVNFIENWHAAIFIKRCIR